MPHRTFKSAITVLTGTIGLAMNLSNAIASDAKTPLFKIITVKDEIVVGLSKADVESLQGDDVTAIGRALSKNGELTVWQFAKTRTVNSNRHRCSASALSAMTPCASSPTRRH